MKQLALSVIFLGLVSLAGCSSSVNKPVEPNQASEQEKQEFQSEQKRVMDLEKQHHRSTRQQNANVIDAEMEHRKKSGIQ